MNKALLICFAPLGALFAAKPPADHAEKMKAGLALFKDTIRPALVESCLKCHGGEKVRADLDLSSRELLLKGGESGSTIDLAKPAESYLLLLLRHEEEPHMPPKKPKLDDGLVNQIEKWISLGAPYDKPLLEKAGKENKGLVVTDSDREFWSFRPLAVEDKPKGNPVDHFVQAKQKEKKVTPNPTASPRTLARRAYLDLLGLPPSPEEMEKFLSDKSPDAWGNLISELLESPHFGERQARYWMDVARFAESFGFEQNYDRPHAYHYRDFLVKAFNEDMPWNQMVKWQLAGDEISPENTEAWKATGFLAAGVFPTQITEAEFEQARYDELDDMVATTGVAFLGLSTGCARCHDHKYDPIPVSDYYEMAATFATAIRSEVEIDFNEGSYQKDHAAWEAKLAKLEKEAEAYRQKQIRPAFEKWLENPLLDLEEIEAGGGWEVLQLTGLQSREGATFKTLEDGSSLASGKNGKTDEYTFTVQLTSGTAAIRLEALAHDSLPRKGPGRAGNGNFALGNLQAQSRPAKGKGKYTTVKLSGARASHEQNKGDLSVKSSLDADINKTGWAVDFGGIGKDNTAIFNLASPLAEDSEVKFTFRFHLNTGHNIGRFRLSSSIDPDLDFETGKGVSQLQLAAKALGKGEALSTIQENALESWFARKDEGWRKAHGQLQKHKATEPQPKKGKVMVCSEGVKPMKNHADGRGYPHFYPQVHHLDRGDPKQKKEVARQGFLEVLTKKGSQTQDWAQKAPESAQTSYRRATLAAWITDTEKGAGHLLARVIVNRIWQQHFGRGIVGTSNDFGLQGDEPTHPGLLDWLAEDLIRNGWKLKRLHKLIMASQTYQQSAAHDKADAKADIDNRYLWKFPTRRLEAEPIRDSLLAVSGKLDRTLYGPGSKSESMTRRSLYFFIKRSQLPNPMIIFDWPEHLVSIGRRPTTTIAPQSLYLMNNPHVRSYAEALAKRSGGSVEKVYQYALSRPPTKTEKSNAEAFLKSQAKQYNGGTTALTDLCQALMASNEFLHLP